MFDIGWSELVIIGVVALIAIGPKELPAVMRTVGQYMGKLRRMASEFQGQFQEAMREAEMADLKKQVDEMTDAATKSFGDLDPMASVRNEIESLSTDPLKDKPATTSEAGTTAAPTALEGASPEAAGQGTPSPVSPDMAIPAPSPDVAVAPEAPQPESVTTSKPASTPGSGA
jgi:sec-independent protein translocase protein TatB